MQFFFCLDEQKELLNTVVTHTLIHENTAKYIQCIHKDYGYSSCLYDTTFRAKPFIRGICCENKVFPGGKKIGRSHYFGRINFKKL